MSDNLPIISVAQTDLLLGNPGYLQRRIIENVEAGYGVRYVEPTNPVMQQMEVAVNLATGCLNGYEAVEQRLYPANAQTYEDLYLHMSDEDYLKVFSVPSEGKVDLYLRTDEIHTYGAASGLNGEKKLIIPRDTIIRVDDYDVVIHNQINIEITQNKGIRITYDMTDISPIKPLASNEVKWDFLNDGRYQYVRIRLPVEQLSHVTSSQSVSSSTGFQQNFGFEDQFYYAIVYHMVNGQWTRMKSTMTEYVYDINDPTAVIKVFDQSIQVTIPTVYFTSGQIGTQVRVDIFSSKGELNIPIQEFESGLYSATFVDFGVSNDPYMTAFQNLPTKFFLGATKLEGGTNRLSFEELRSLVIMNSAGAQDIPITPAQLQRRGAVQGYDIVENVDHITNRKYLATRDILPDVSKVDGQAPLPVTMATLMSTFNKLQVSNDTNLGHTADRLTILPTALFKMNNGQMSLVSNADKAAIMAMSTDQKVTLLNNNDYLYTPFYYVLDTGETRFRTRVYSLDNPTVPVKNFVLGNETTGVEVNAVQHTIEKTATGYKLTLLTESNDVFKDIIESDYTRFNCQLSFVVGDSARVFMNSTVSVDGLNEPITEENGEYFIEFDITTIHDVNELDQLMLTSFGQDNITTAPTGAELSQVFDLVYIVDDVQQVGQIGTAIDDLINESFLDAGAVIHAGITHDQITIKFGDALKNLWVRDKTSVEGQTYMTYSSNVYEFWAADTFKYVNGVIEVVYNSGNDTYERTIENYQGDPKFSASTTTTDTAATSLNDTTINTTVSTFTAGDVGKHFVLVGGDVNGNGRLVGQITSFVDDMNVGIDTPVTVATSAGAEFIFGDAIVKHTQGDPILDAAGNPTPVAGDRDLIRETDLLMFDGAYYFATAANTVAYKNTVKEDLVEWITQEIQDISKGLLENTEIYFYPRKTIGTVDVYTVDGGETSLDAKQVPTVRVFVSSETYQNDALMAAIEENIATVLNTEIKRETVDYSQLTRNITAALGNSVQSVKVDNLFEGREHIVTVKDSTQRFSIGKLAIVLSDGTLAVKDSIIFQHYRHDPA